MRLTRRRSLDGLFDIFYLRLKNESCAAHRWLPTDTLSWPETSRLRISRHLDRYAEKVCSTNGEHRTTRSLAQERNIFFRTPQVTGWRAQTWEVQSERGPAIRSTVLFADLNTMKLYKVHIEYETVIRAKSKEDAVLDAHYTIRHEADDEPDVIFADEIKTAADLPAGWDQQCRPWGERDPLDRTIADILANALVSHPDKTSQL